MEVLSIQDLGKTWPGGVRALNSISFEAVPGSLTAVIGPSGSGKSTLLRVIAGLDSPNRGAIVNPFGPAGLCFSEPSLWPHLTLLENVRLPLMVVRGFTSAKADERSRQILQDWGLDQRLTAYPAELSLGQQQRGALARTAVMDPKVVCLDEITSSLDPELAASIIESLVEWKRTGAIIIAATHQRELLQAAADYIVFLEHGNVVQQGTANQVLNSDHERTRAFLDATPQKRMALKEPAAGRKE